MPRPKRPRDLNLLAKNLVDELTHDPDEGKDPNAVRAGRLGGNENLSHAVALYFMYYNFCRVHQTIKTTPAVASGLADHEWTIEELVGLLDPN